MKKLPENFCIAPFWQITSHPTKSFSPCPYLGGTTWARNYKNIITAWNSPEIEQLRSSFLNNEKNPICSRCWNEESHNKQSLRLRLFDPTSHTSQYKFLSTPDIANEILDKIYTGEYHQGPKVLSIKNGNVCNAKCRTCHPGDSSRWAADANKLYNNTGRMLYQINQNEVNWTDSQVNDLFLMSKNLERLELFGGEPLYNKQVIKLLQRIVATGHSQNLTLYINTNGSVDIVTKLPEIVKFKRVEIGVSVDALHDKFNYIRHGLDYAKVISNVQSWQNSFRQHSVDYHISAICTVNIFNILDLIDIRKELIKVFDQEPFWNLLVDPDFLNIAQMPESLRVLAADRLDQEPIFSDIVALLRQNHLPQAWQRFIQLTQDLDKIRRESFTKTFPELSELAKTCHSQDLAAVNFGKIIVFVGDREHPQGWYLRNSALKHSRDAVRLDVKNMVALRPGVYYTSLEDLGTKTNFEKIMAQADKIVYQEPSWWQDTPGVIKRWLGRKSPSKQYIDTILTKHTNVTYLASVK